MFAHTRRPGAVTHAASAPRDLGDMVFARAPGRVIARHLGGADVLEKLNEACSSGDREAVMPGKRWYSKPVPDGAVNRLASRLSLALRAKRMQRFWHEFHLNERTRVLDVGGTLDIWRLLPRRPALVMLNLTLPKGQPGVSWIIGDGRRLPFVDKAFDIVFSNSVIEHLGSIDNQQLFASECRRVGVRYYVESPNRHFPIEPHIFTPLLHFLPQSVQLRLLRNFSVWGWLVRPTHEQCEHFLREVRLLSRREMMGLFPDAEIQCERVFGFAKALIAVRK